MSMQRAIALVTLALLLPLVAQAGGPALFHLSLAEAPPENGKVMSMDFQEIARDAEKSTVQVTGRFRGSVSSSMFAIRGTCGLARARGKQNFAIEQVPGNTELFIVTFPDTPPAPRKGITMAQCELLGY
jgi:hypothetical protein